MKQLIGLPPRLAAWSAALAFAMLLAGCERPPVNTVQRGYRGTAMEQVYNPRTVADQAALNTVPPALPMASADGPKAKDIYKNVQVLGDLSVGEFARHMVTITSWVAPKEGCTYCHAGANFADESKYQKVVARRMIQMTQHLNSTWQKHVVGTGVTCYTCHRGNNVPVNQWFTAAEPKAMGSLIGERAGQNAPSDIPALASLPSDPFTPLLGEPSRIRVVGKTPLPEGNRHSVKETEWTYALMMHMSQSLGVNCTYCHNTRSFSSWDLSPPTRTSAYWGIRMVGDVNKNYLEPLTKTFPPHRLGPTGDVGKVNCATCHQGAYKPLYGVSMLKDHPELSGVKAVVTTPTAAAAPADDASMGSPEGATIFFAVGSSTLGADAAPALDALISMLNAHPDAKITISGFHSASGDLASNQDLAKKRAFSVRDALKAAGIAEDRVALQKPMSAEANLAGEDPKSRRVEVAVAK
jgi:photosynthetic reaction center cytochrome c subunit